MTILFAMGLEPWGLAYAGVSTPYCPEKSFLGEVQSTTKVRGEVVVKRKWVPIPKEWGPHGGAYHGLKVESLSANRLELVFQKESEENFQTVKSKKVSLRKRESDFSLTQWLDENKSLRDLSGRLRIFLFNDEKALCHFDMTVQRSESP